MAIKNFLTDEDEQAVVKSIAAAELKTSGEIRLHIERRCKGDSIERAQAVFRELKMYETKERNGVLIYIALLDHIIVVWGDDGIHKKAGQSFWDQEVATLVESFKKQQYKDGLCTLILNIGNKLSALFPYQSDDENELDNSISFNDN